MNHRIPYGATTRAPRPGHRDRSPRRNGRRAFTLVELLVVMAIVGTLAAMLLPATQRALAAGRRVGCANNIRHMQIAFTLYLDDHEGRWFPWKEETPEGTLWYWGLERNGPQIGAEGSRPLDKSRARLAPYIGSAGGVEICSALPYHAPYFKRKYEIASYGYGLNAYLLAGIPSCDRSGVRTIHQVRNPSDIITWADSIQINTWQAPASSSNPMLEEWYYLDGFAPPKFHFRHDRRLNAAFADSSVRALPPHQLDPRCDGKAGYLEPLRQETLLRTGPLAP